MSYATDGKCHNAEPGTYGHECGKPATWIGTKSNGYRSGFCDHCKEHGWEASDFVKWERVATTSVNVETLRREFGRLKRLQPGGPIYRKLADILDNASDEALLEIKDAKIPFVSALALNRCILRNLI